MPAADLPATAGAFTTILTAFTSQLKVGGQAITDYQADLCLTFFTLQYLKAGAEVGLARNVKSAVATFIGGCVWYGVARNAVPIVDGFIQWMASIGTMAGVGGGGAVLTDPSGLLDVGIKSIQGMGRATDGLNILVAGGVLLMMVGTLVLTLLGYTLIGCIAVFVVVQSYVKAMVGVSLFPFLIEPSTRFLAMPGVGMVIGAGVSLGTTSMVLSIGHGAMQKLMTLPPGQEWTLGPAMNVMMGSFLIAVLSGACAFLGNAVGGKVGAITRSFQSASR